MKSDEYRSYTGQYSDVEIGIHLKGKTSLCAGLGAATCTKVLQAEGKVTAQAAFSNSEVSISADNNFDDFVTLTTTYTASTSQEASYIDSDVIMVRSCRHGL